MTNHKEVPATPFNTDYNIEYRKPDTAPAQPASENPGLKMAMEKAEHQLEWALSGEKVPHQPATGNAALIAESNELCSGWPHSHPFRANAERLAAALAAADAKTDDAWRSATHWRAKARFYEECAEQAEARAEANAALIEQCLSEETEPDAIKVVKLAQALKAANALIEKQTQQIDSWKCLAHTNADQAKKIKELKRALTTANARVAQAEARAETATARVHIYREAAQRAEADAEDAERLDWVLSQCHQTDRAWIGSICLTVHQDGIRAAIDAAKEKK